MMLCKLQISSMTLFVPNKNDIFVSILSLIEIADIKVRKNNYLRCKFKFLLIFFVETTSVHLTFPVESMSSENSKLMELQTSLPREIKSISVINMQPI